MNVAVVKNAVYASDSEQEPIRKPTCDTVAVKHPVAERYIDISCFFVLCTAERLEFVLCTVFTRPSTALAMIEALGTYLDPLIVSRNKG